MVTPYRRRKIRRPAGTGKVCAPSCDDGAGRASPRGGGRRPDCSSCGAWQPLRLGGSGTGVPSVFPAERDSLAGMRQPCAFDFGSPEEVSARPAGADAFPVRSASKSSGRGLSCRVPHRGSGSRAGWRLPATRPTASARSRTGTRPATVHGVGRRAGMIPVFVPGSRRWSREVWAAGIDPA